MNMRWMLQVTEACATDRDAADVLLRLSEQETFVAGRVLEPTGSRTWTAQAFYRDEPATPGAWLPEGIKRVVVMARVLEACGVKGVA